MSRTESFNRFDYLATTDVGEFNVVNSLAVLRRFRATKTSEGAEPIMGLRLSSGIVGELDCRAVNSRRVPKGRNEVVLGIGQSGVAGLIELGGLPCLTCKSGDSLADMGIDSVNNPSWLRDNYDSRRLDWQKLCYEFGLSPGRIYTRPNLPVNEVEEFADIFVSAGLVVPDIGYYDPSSDSHFTEYSV